MGVSRLSRFPAVKHLREQQSWVFQLDLNGETIYLCRSDNFGAPNEIWQFDIASRSQQCLPNCQTPTSAGSEDFITGYDLGFERQLYILAFSMYDDENATLSASIPELRCAR